MSDERFRAAIPARFEVGAVMASGKIRNVESGGLFVETASIPEQGETVDRVATPILLVLLSAHTAHPLDGLRVVDVLWRPVKLQEIYAALQTPLEETPRRPPQIRAKITAEFLSLGDGFGQ